MGIPISNISNQEMKTILKDAKVIAVVGHSDKPTNLSYQIAKFLKAVGYKVYPVNPTIEQIDGEKSYASVAEIPEPVDIVDVFRRSEYLEGVVDDAIAAGAKNVWAQLGIYDADAGEKAKEAGLGIVMNRCIRATFQQLMM